MTETTQEVAPETPVGTVFRLSFWTGIAWRTVYFRTIDPPDTEHLTALLLTETAKLEALG